MSIGEEEENNFKALHEDINLQLYKLTVVSTHGLCASVQTTTETDLYGKRQQASTCPAIGFIVLLLYIITTPKVPIKIK